MTTSSSSIFEMAFDAGEQLVCHAWGKPNAGNNAEICKCEAGEAGKETDTTNRHDNLPCETAKKPRCGFKRKKADGPDEEHIAGKPPKRKRIIRRLKESRYTDGEYQVRSLTPQPPTYPDNHCPDNQCIDDADSLKRKASPIVWLAREKPKADHNVEICKCKAGDGGGEEAKKPRCGLKRRKADTDEEHVAEEPLKQKRKIQRLKELGYIDGEYQVRSLTPHPPTYPDNHCTDDQCINDADFPKRSAFTLNFAKTSPAVFHAQEKPKAGHNVEICKCEAAEGGKESDESNNNNDDSPGEKAKKTRRGMKRRRAADADEEHIAEEPPKWKRKIQRFKIPRYKGGKHLAKSLTLYPPVYPDIHCFDDQCVNDADYPKRKALMQDIAKTAPVVCHAWGKTKVGHYVEICKFEAGEGDKGIDKVKNSNTPPGEKVKKPTRKKQKRKKTDADGLEPPKQESVVRRMSEEERKRISLALAKIRAMCMQIPSATPGVGKNVPLKTKSKVARLTGIGFLHSRKPSKYL